MGERIERIIWLEFSAIMFGFFFGNTIYAIWSNQYLGVLSSIVFLMIGIYSSGRAMEKQSYLE